MNIKSKRNATELYPIQDHRNGTLKVTQPMPVCHFTYMFNIISEMHQSLSVTDSRRPQSPQSRHCCLLFISFNNSTTHMRHMRRLIHPGHPRRIPYRSPLPVLAAYRHTCVWALCQSIQGTQETIVLVNMLTMYQQAASRPPRFFFSFWGMYFRRCDCMRFIGLSRPRVSHGRRSCQPLWAVCLAVCLAGCLSVRWMRPQPSLISGWYPIGHYWHYSMHTLGFYVGQEHV